MRNSFSVRLALLSLLLLAGGRADAVPPLISDDVPTADQQGFELYMGYRYENDEGDARRSLPVAELVYGVTDIWEISIAPSYVSEAGVNGFDDLGIGTKYNFLKENDHRPGVALNIEVTLPIARKSSDLGTGGYDSNFVLCAQKTWKWFTAYANAGYGILPVNRMAGEIVARKNTAFLSFATGWQVASKTKLFAETFFQSTNEAGESNISVIDLGWEQSLRENFKLQVTLGKSLRSGRGGGPGSLVYIGFEWDFEAPWKHGEKGK